MNPFDLTGQTAIITGSSKGIGRAIAEHMARAGANVVISSRKAEPCEEVANAICAAGGKAVAIPAHVGRKEDLERLVSETRKAFGPITTLVANAASNPYYGPITEISDEAFQKTIDTNILSVIRLCGLVHPDMQANGGGSIMVVSSIGAVKASTTLGVYAISKAGDLQLVRNLAAEWGKDSIRVNSILPGLVKTDFARALWENPEAEKQASEQFPLGRLGVPDDIAPAAVFLASKGSSWMTGQQILIDGGSVI